MQKKYKIVSFPVVEIDELIPNFNESISHFAFLDGGSLPTDIGLLQAIAKKYSGCKYFEIGTWRGESVANVSNYAGECYTLNLSSSELIQSGLTEKYASMQGFFSRELKNIVHLQGNSLTYDFSSLNKKFDLVFIDGDHRHGFVKSDTEKVFAHLIHEKSIIVWHDYGYDPENIRYEVMDAILEGSPEKFHDHLYHVSNTLCAIFTREKLKTTIIDVPVEPTKEFRVDIRTNRRI